MTSCVMGLLLCLLENFDDIIPALGPIVSFKFSLLCITNQSKTVAEVERNTKLV